MVCVLKQGHLLACEACKLPLTQSPVPPFQGAKNIICSFIKTNPMIHQTTTLGSTLSPHSHTGPDLQTQADLCQQWPSVLVKVHRASTPCNGHTYLMTQQESPSPTTPAFPTQPLALYQRLTVTPPKPALNSATQLALT